MVDVGPKPVTQREAVARASVYMQTSTIALITKGAMPKGDVLSTARIAGIMAAKKTPEIIPLCHTLLISSVEVDFKVDKRAGRIVITSRVKSEGKTGVEMEALTAVSASALTIYDMCKAVDKEMTIGDIILLEKRGGRSGEWKRDK